MKSKTLLLLGVVGAASLGSASAQVYSVNAVGYINKAVPSGFSIIASPLSAPTNSLANVIKTAPESTQVFKFNSSTGRFVARTYSSGDGGWIDDNLTLADLAVAPGEGFFVFAPSAFTNTFVGEVMQGNLTNSLPAGFSLVSSMVPQAGGIQTVLGYAPTVGDTVYKFVSGSYQTFNYVGVNSWEDNNLNATTEPSLALAEGVFIFKGAAGKWTRTFSVN
jgi:hypothetical protein